jgi:hypothetical protein
MIDRRLLPPAASRRAKLVVSHSRVVPDYEDAQQSDLRRTFELGI